MNWLNEQCDVCNKPYHDNKMDRSKYKVCDTCYDMAISAVVDRELRAIMKTIEEINTPSHKEEK